MDYDGLLAEKKAAEKRIAELEAENGRMEKFFLGACEKIGVEINFPYAGNPLEVIADHFDRASSRIAELEEFAISVSKHTCYCWMAIGEAGSSKHLPGCITGMAVNVLADRKDV